MKTNARFLLLAVLVSVLGLVLAGCCLLNPKNCPPIILTQPESQIVKVGSSATFSVVAQHGSPNTNAPLNYQWKLNGVDIPGANNSTYTTPALSFADVGNAYKVVVSGSPSTDSKTAYLSVYSMNGNIGTMQTDVNAFENHSSLNTVCGSTGWTKWKTFVIFYGPNFTTMTGDFQNTPNGNQLDVDTWSTANGTTVDTLIRVRENTGGLNQISCNNNANPPFTGFPKLSKCVNAPLNPTQQQEYRVTIYLKQAGTLPFIEWHWVYHN